MNRRSDSPCLRARAGQEADGAIQRRSRADHVDSVARYVALVGVIAAALSLAVLWVYLVPMLEASDETEHFDYVLALVHAGRLLPGRPVFNPITTATADDETRFFETYTDFYRVNLNRHDRVPEGYGTHQYFRRIDHRAAARFPARWTYWDDPQRPKPGLIDLYPFGFYGTNALWLRVFSAFDSSAVSLFFAARWFSVALLALALAFVYGVARELRLPGWTSLALTAIIGMHSLTSFVASYVQPDNMAFALTSMILYFSLRLRRRGVQRHNLAVLAISLGVLAITKYQFFACVALVVCSMIAVEVLRYRYSKAARLQFATILAGPSAIALAAQRIIIGSDPHYVKSHLLALQTFPNFETFAAWLATFGALTIQAFYHFFIGGFHSELEADPHYSGSVSYWGNSGWLDTPLTFGNAAVDTFVHLIIQSFNVAILLLSMAWIVRTLSRLASLYLKGKRWTALRLAVANTPINLYFVFTAFMVFFFAITNNALRLSGRDWLPVIEPAFLLGFLYAPRAIPNRRFRKVFGATVLSLLALYASVGSYYAALSVHTRYYGAPYLPPLAALTPGHATDIGIARIYSAPVDNAIDAPIDTGPGVIHGDILHIAGWAADIDRQRAAGGVIALIDGRDEFPATYGYSNVPIADQLHNFLYYWAGYEFHIPTKNLGVGPHNVSFDIVSSGLKTYFPARQTVHFSIVPPTTPQPYTFHVRGLIGSIDRLASPTQDPSDPNAAGLWLPAHDTLLGNGWMIGGRRHHAVQHAYATIDGRLHYEVRLREPRLDLIKQFPTIPELAAAYSGFSVRIPLQRLASGPHRFTLSAIDGGAHTGAVVLARDIPFTTYPPSAIAPMIHTSGLGWPIKIGGRKNITGYIDGITSLADATEHSWLAGPTWFSTQNVMLISGWTLDLSHQRAMDDLWARVDDGPRFPARAGGFRSDIPQAYPRLPLLRTYYSGFTIPIPMHGFRTGRHHMTLWAIDPATKRPMPLSHHIPFTLF